MVAIRGPCAFHCLLADTRVLLADAVPFRELDVWVLRLHAGLHLLACLDGKCWWLFSALGRLSLTQCSLSHLQVCLLGKEPALLDLLARGAVHLLHDVVLLAERHAVRMVLRVVLGDDFPVGDDDLRADLVVVFLRGGVAARAAEVDLPAVAAAVRHAELSLVA